MKCGCSANSWRVSICPPEGYHSWSFCFDYFSFPPRDTVARLHGACQEQGSFVLNIYAFCFPLAVHSRKCNCYFKSELKKKWNYLFQIWFQTVNVYHPQSDCYVERYNDRFSISAPRFQNGEVILLKIWMHGQLNDFEILGY